MTAAHLKAPDRPAPAEDGCWKMKFESRAEATKHATGGGIKAHPYRCLRCGKWHLSSKSPQQYRKQVAMARGEV